MLLRSVPADDMAYGYVFGAMGTSCSLRLFADSRHQADMRAALAVSEVERIEGKYSRYKLESALSVINREAENGNTVAVDAETAGCWIMPLPVTKKATVFSMSLPAFCAGRGLFPPVICQMIMRSKRFCR